MNNSTVETTTWHLLNDDPDNIFLCAKEDVPYTGAELEALIDREATIRSEWQSNLRHQDKEGREKGTYSTTEPVRYLAVEALPAIIEGVNALLNKLSTVNPGRNKQKLELLVRLPYLQFCVLAFTIAVDSAIKQENLVSVITKIGSACQTEAKWKHYKERESKFFDMLLKQQRKNNQSTDHITKVLTIAMNRKARGEYGDEEGDSSLEWDAWTKGDEGFTRWLGNILLDIIVTQTGLFKIENDNYSPRHPEKTARLYTTEKFDNFIAQTGARIGMYGGYYLPLPVPPRDWTTTKCGGYWTKYAGQKKLIKNWSKGYQEEILNYSEQLAPVVFKAINAAQHTGWRINERIYDVLCVLKDEKKAIAGLPPAEDPQMPVCPECGQEVKKGHKCFSDPHEKDKAAYIEKLVKQGKKKSQAKEAAEVKYGANKSPSLRMWKMAAHDVHTECTRLKSLRLTLHIGLEIANLLRDDRAFYYVYQTDFRGRLYPMGVLNPQGTDWQKGLLEFAEGVELGKNGVKWLAIHIANCWGYDKASYSDRVKWTQEHEEMILACAENPLSVLEWAKADSPFMFLAACFEWQGYKQEGESYKSHCAVALDGSCSGIQHYSAMLRDKTGAIATNVKCLDPNAKKNDIYGKVAEETIKIMTRDTSTAEDGERAIFMLSHNLIDRKVVKRAVMTQPYGSRYYSCADYVSEELNDRLFNAGVHDKKQIKTLCDYASKTVWAAIPKVIQKAREGMAYLQTLARLFNKTKMPITWTTPTGFIVQQSYFVNNAARIRLFTGGSIQLKGKIPVYTMPQDEGIKLSFMENDSDKKEIDPAKQASGIAPNFIHSLDASHLMFSVCNAKDNGINDYALIHDSLGTHAGKTEEFAVLIRENFYRLYHDFDPLGDITRHLLEQLDEKTRKSAPEIPTTGDLDIEDIKTAIYLFS